MMSRKNVGILGTLAYPKILVTQKKKLSVPLGLLDSFGPALTIFEMAYYASMVSFRRGLHYAIDGLLYLFYLYTQAYYDLACLSSVLLCTGLFLYNLKYIYEYLGAGASYRSIETGGSTISFTDNLSHVILMFRLVRYICLNDYNQEQI